MLTMTLKYSLDTERCTDQADTHPWFFPLEPFFINIYFYILGDCNLGVFTRGLELGVSPQVEVMKKKATDWNN